VTTFVEYDEDGEARRMRCGTCGGRAPFDQSLPYVNQTASFTTGHDCVLVLPGSRDEAAEPPR
jgi:hypothetical protein